MNENVMPLALDSQLNSIVRAIRANHAPPPFSGTPKQARERLSRSILSARERAPMPVVGQTRDCVAEYGNGRVPVRVYRPLNASLPLATVVFFHGGGFVLGSVELMDDIARKLCRDLNAVIVSVEYRLAPEHPFPAAHDDALTATLWARENVLTLGGDASRFAVAGESAGGNLAASTALALRDRGYGLTAQLLVVPGVDMARDTKLLESDGRDFPMLSPSDLRDIARLYMGANVALSNQSPPSPLHAANLAGLPPTIIALAGHDPLYGEGLAYAQRLGAADVAVQLYRFEDMFHPFFGFFEASAAAHRANDTLCQAFAELLRRQPLPSPE